MILVDRVKPYRFKAREDAPLPSTLLKEYTEKLETHAIIRRNGRPQWASPVVPVKKPGGGFRITTNYRGFNSMTVPITGTMPSLASTAGAVLDAVVFTRSRSIEGLLAASAAPGLSRNVLLAEQRCRLYTYSGATRTKRACTAFLGSTTTDSGTAVTPQLLVVD